MSYDESTAMAAMPERALWRAVVFQAFRDAQQFSDTLEQRRACAWLFSSGEDRNHVFDLAGISPDHFCPRAAAVVVRVAKACARGKEPKVIDGRVRWVRPARWKVEGAAEFLRSAAGVQALMQIDGSLDDAQADEVLAKAVLASKDRAA